MSKSRGHSKNTIYLIVFVFGVGSVAIEYKKPIQQYIIKNKITVIISNIF
jgi:hypothetical protein